MKKSGALVAIDDWNETKDKDGGGGNSGATDIHISIAENGYFVSCADDSTGIEERKVFTNFDDVITYIRSMH